MVKGNLTKWLKKDEQIIKVEDVIAEIEYDESCNGGQIIGSGCK